MKPAAALSLLLAALLLVGGGFGLGRLTAGAPGETLVPLPSGEIPVDPSDGPEPTPDDTDEDGVLSIWIDADGRLRGAGATYTERTGELVLVVRDAFEGPLLVAIERDRGNDQWEVVYEVSFDRPTSGEASIDVAAAGTYRISVIPGNPPGEATTARLVIVERAAP